MTGQEIRQKINDLYREQGARVDIFSTFVFNPDVSNFNAQIRELQSICPHEFKDGLCIYCDKGEL